MGMMRGSLLPPFGRAGEERGAIVEEEREMAAGTGGGNDCKGCG
jgi:hypothetical protein